MKRRMGSWLYCEEEENVCLPALEEACLLWPLIIAQHLALLPNQYISGSLTY